ncbi:6-bladed beta-propeller [Algoriphagus chordae]|uniref:6-bladed beta-propeller protein n=1 Tax=Algoriphagus chordae TaxID=237019 RepID=A0A2W7QH62_9BACT|nr:6-bladed beta-propeller [Algoriphagus chordae]PZX47794.1 6-bladed beta-propeller protein [Algoriphagus chordae]
MKIINILFLIFFSIVLISCSSQREDLIKIKTLQFQSGSRIVDFSEISDNLEIVLLNIPDSVSLGRIHSIRYYADYLILHDKDYAQALYIFNKSGDFINTLRRIGSGPGEFTTLESYIIHEDNLAVYDRGLQKIIKYQLPNLSFLESFEASGYFRGDLLNWNSFGHSIGLSDDELENGSYRGLVFLDENYQVIFNNEKPAGVIEASQRGNLSNIGNRIFYAEPFSEIIYAMDSLDFSPVYQVDFGKNSLPKIAQSLEEAEDFYEILRSQDYAFAVHNFNLIDSVISFNFYWRTIEEIRIGLYDLINDRGIIISDIGPLEDYLMWPFSVSDGYNLSILYPDEYDKEILLQMGLSTDEISKFDMSKPFLLKYSINNFPNQ